MFNVAVAVVHSRRDSDPQALNESHQRAPAKAGSLAVDALCLASGTNTHALRLLCTQHSCQTQAWRHRFPTRSRLDSGFDQTLTECKELQAYVTLLSFSRPTQSIHGRIGREALHGMPAGGGRSTTKITSQGRQVLQAWFWKNLAFVSPCEPFQARSPATSFGPACRAGVHRTAPRTDTAVAA